MKLSKQNQFQGTIQRLNVGAVNAEVILELPGGLQVAAMIPKEAVKELELVVGQPACAVIKPADVTIGVCCGHKDCTCDGTGSRSTG